MRKHHPVVAEDAVALARRAGGGDGDALGQQVAAATLVGGHGGPLDVLVVERSFDIDRQLPTHALVLIGQGHRLQHRAARVELCGERIVHRVVLLHVHRIFDDEFLCDREHAAQVEGADAGRVVKEVQQVAAATCLAQCAHTQCRQNLPHFVRDVQQVLSQRARVALEHLGVGCQPRRALDVAVLGHHTLEHHQRGGPELEAVRSQQRRLDHVAGRLVRAGAAQHHLLSYSIGAERLMHFGDTDFGRPPRILEARDRRRARAAGIARHVDDIGARLGHAYRNGSDALGGHQFDDHPDPGRLAIVDQLGEVLDRVCVVVGRGRDELDTRCSTAGGRDLDGHLRSRKLAAFTGFSALADLDLEFLEHRVGKVASPHPETAGGELLDAGAADSAVSADVLTALTAVGEAANQIGSMCHGLVCRGH
ncbi:Uncharacterised protein [Mycobacteroides abscessus subsp. abscessus]|nr:Uncharacterised protein [Mycobacteroides abscessus subsp. abscessus]